MKGCYCIVSEFEARWMARCVECNIWVISDVGCELSVSRMLLEGK